MNIMPLTLVAVCSSYLRNIIKFYRCIQLLQAKMIIGPFNLAHPVEGEQPTRTAVPTLTEAVDIDSLTRHTFLFR